MRAFVLVFLAVSLIVIGDTAGKLLAGQGVEPRFTAWSRFALAALILAPIVGIRGAEWRALADWRLWLRAGLISGGILSILTALRTAPISDAYGAFYVGPVVAFALAASLLKERVTPARAALVLTGFAGVMLIVRPGLAPAPGVGFALASGVFYGGYLAATRWLAGAYRPGFLLLSQLLVGALLLAPIGAGAVPAGAGPGVWALVAVSALGSAAGNYLLVRVSRTVPASVVAPLVYTQLVSATLAGILVFGDWPTPLTLAGLAVILASGLATIRLAGTQGAAPGGGADPSDGGGPRSPGPRTSS